VTKTTSKHVVVSGGFDNLRSPHIRFLQEAARAGRLTVMLWNDLSLRRLSGAAPKFPQAEREYLLSAIRFVSEVKLVEGPPDVDSLPEVEGPQPECWVVESGQDNSSKKSFCTARGIQYCVLPHEALGGFPEIPATPAAGKRKKVVVTGCYDWFHSGHVRFFEEVSSHGDLYVVVGNDANVRLLKGASHPMHSQDERRYAAGSIRFVTQALVSSGQGWLDAEPEIDRLRPDIYAVNEDGDQGGKREFCAGRGIEYLVLKRTPAAGLPRRTSTNLRGF
jgi:cytidyltransferase-like protein